MPTEFLPTTTSSKLKCAMMALTSHVQTFKNVFHFSRKITFNREDSLTLMRLRNGNSLERSGVTPLRLLQFHLVNLLMRMTRFSRDSSLLAKIDVASNTTCATPVTTLPCPFSANSSLRWKPSPLAASGTPPSTSKKAFSSPPTTSTKLSFGTLQL